MQYDKKQESLFFYFAYLKLLLINRFNYLLAAFNRRFSEFLTLT